jgi:hypothetical protein
MGRPQSIGIPGDDLHLNNYIIWYTKCMELIKSNIKKVYLWVIILIVIVALALVAFYKKPAGGLSDAEKQAILNDLVNSSTANLSEQQKIDAMNDLSSGQSANVSDEDRQNVLNSLGQ